MTDEDLQALVTQTFLCLADLLEAQPEPGWDTPSLCAGWRVREVVAHMTMAARYDEPAFMTMLADDDFDFTRLSNRVAEQDAQLPVADLLGQLRDERLHQWTPPGGGQQGALNHAVIHGLDVTVPLGVGRPCDDSSIRVVLDELTHGGGHKHFGTEIGGRTLEATDIGWSYGTGPALRGSAADLALHICGRQLPEGSLN